jgi:Zn-dependent metalloprotease
MIPNFVFENIIKNEPAKKSLYVKNILEAETHRTDRKVFYTLRKKGILPVSPPTHIEHIIHYDNQQSWDYRTDKIIEEFKENHQTDQKKYPTSTLAKFLDGIYDVLHDYYDRESYDNSNRSVLTHSNFGKSYSNAFWDGSQLCFGNGDGVYFNTFVIADVVGHELGHAVQDHEAAFIYQGQSGALNEHISDVFGITFDQILKDQDVNSSKWLIGEGLWTSKVNGIALRSMKEPGTAYDDPVVGKDPQIKHYSEYYETDEDEGGVHIFSSLGNLAFYLANIKKGGKIHENGIGHIWYNTMLKKSGLSPYTNYHQFAQATVNNAQEFSDKEIIHEAWDKVGIITNIPSNPNPPNPPTEPDDNIECPVLNLIYKFNSFLTR